MAIRSFAHPLRVGNDICKIERVLKICGPGFVRINPLVRRIFTPREASYFRASFCGNKGFIDSCQFGKVAQFLAGRWAAKEAVIKALADSRHLTPADIEIWPKDSRKPFALIYDQSQVWTREDYVSIEVSKDVSVLNTDNHHPLVTRVTPPPLDPSINCQIADVSIAHDGNYATAVAMALIDKELTPISTKQ